MNIVALARLHGIFNVLNGLWPLLHMHSFEAVFGPKTDKWLVRTVAGLLLVNGLVQLRTHPAGQGVEAARFIGLGTAATLASIDLAYAPRGHISRMYLVDAAVELAWIVMWSRRKTAKVADTK
ncbi:hypothetical protein M1D88_02610 [Arthrobacter sp. R1-13]